MAQRKPEAAEPLYRQALAIAEKAHGPNHPDAAKALFGLGVALERDGQTTEAAECLRRALTIRRDLLGPQHPDTREAARAFAALRQG